MVTSYHPPPPTLFDPCNSTAGAGAGAGTGVGIVRSKSVGGGGWYEVTTTVPCTTASADGGGGDQYIWLVQFLSQTLSETYKSACPSLPDLDRFVETLTGL